MKKLFILLFIALIISSCSATDTAPEEDAAVNEEDQQEVQQNESEPQAKEIIGVSIVPQETFLNAIIDNGYEIVTLIPPGSSPATHQPSIRTLQKLSEAKLYFSIDVPTEKANILPMLDEYNNLKIIDLAERVDAVHPPRYFNDDEIHDEEHDDHDDDHDIHDDEDHDQDAEDDHHEADENESSHEDHDHDGRDPHIWLSPKRAITMLEVMTDELIKVYPEDKALFEANKENYKEKLVALDEYIQSKIENAQTKSFIIYHPSYGYLAEDYGLNMIEIEADGKSASINRLDEITRIAEENNIDVVYYQEEMSFKQAEIVANEIDGQTIKLKPLSSDYIESQKMFIDSLVGE